MLKYLIILFNLNSYIHELCQILSFSEKIAV